jgi:adenylate cyclase
VVHADIVGYSRLIGLDDVGTLERLRALRRDVIDPAIAEHGGRIVNTAGDALLIVFDSIDGAVRCALEVQQQVPDFDRDRPPDNRIRFRIGINAGDAIPEGTDLHGDVVNVAARLQAECPPGGICISRAVREHVRGRLELPFELKGPLNLKNIAQPVETFVLQPDAANKSVERTLLHGTGEALPLPDKPSIAVLAFTNMSGDAEQEYFSDGIADDIITELSRSRSLFVIARNSSFTYKGRAVDIKQVARELGVKYVLEGSVRRSSGRVRVGAQLIDAATGNHVWAERYDRALEDVFAVQDEITMAVVTAMQPALAKAEARRILSKPPDSLEAWEAYQRGLWHMGKSNAADIEQAQQFLQRAITLDARFVPAYTALGATYLLQGATFVTRPLPECAKVAIGWASKAVEIDPNDAEAQATLAWTEAMLGIREEHWSRVSLALEIDPNSQLATLVQGLFLIFAGGPSEGRAALLTVLRRDPHGPVNVMPVMSQIAVSYYFEHNYEKALDAARRSVSLYPGLPITYRYVAASLAQLGRVGEARDALQRAIEIAPHSFDFYVHSRPPWLRPEDYEHMLDGLRKAGWQG